MLYMLQFAMDRGKRKWSTLSEHLMSNENAIKSFDHFSLVDSRLGG